MNKFEELGVSGATLKGVQKAGYTTPSPIQMAAIPIAHSGRDLIGCAQTGTGKTAAFVLPMLQRLTELPRPRSGRPIRALVLAPTRELALQVETAIRKYGSYNRFWSMSIYGGVPIPPQLRQLRKGVEIVVATPGRLLDHINRGTADLSEVEILVLDEADRMLDMGFINDIRKIVAETPKTRQTLLFSATMPKAIQALTRSIQKKPEYIEIGHQHNPAETVTQQVCKVKSPAKMDLLCHVLKTEDTDNVLVFSRTKHRADRIVQRLERKGFAATVMHSNRSQNQRQRSLEGFRTGKYQIMVATDIAARGIDVESISHVINFDTPHHPEDYIHRIGRTGRAEAKGEAITFVDRDEERYLRDIERHTGQQLAQKVYEDYSGASVSSTDGAERSERSSRPQRPRRTERTQRPQRSARPQRSEGSERPKTAGRTDSSPRSDATDRSERPRQTTRTQRPQRPARSQQFERTEIPKTAESTESSPSAENTTRPRRQRIAGEQKRPRRSSQRRAQERVRYGR